MIGLPSLIRLAFFGFRSVTIPSGVAEVVVNTPKVIGSDQRDSNAIMALSDAKSSGPTCGAIIFVREVPLAI